MTRKFNIFTVNKDETSRLFREGNLLASRKSIDQIKLLLVNMGLNEYQASALAYLLLIGETKATTLSRASGLPSARIYGVLDELARMGLVTVRPGRPMFYRARPPDEIASSLISFGLRKLKQSLEVLEDYAGDFAKIAGRIYLKDKKSAATIPLLRIVSVGEVSLEETRKLYDSAEEEILILSRAIEYFPEVVENLKNALAKGTALKIILMSPELLEPEDREKQASILKRIREESLAKAEIHFSKEVPIRGCIIDPEKGGKALFLVEDPGVSLYLREAAVTSHPSVVKGLATMFNLMWEHKSKP